MNENKSGLKWRVINKEDLRERNDEINKRI